MSDASSVDVSPVVARGPVEWAIFGLSGLFLLGVTGAMLVGAFMADFEGAAALRVSIVSLSAVGLVVWSRDRTWDRARSVLAAVFLLTPAAMLVIWGVSSAQSNTGNSTTTVNPQDQDPACHSAALASASRDPGFQWNVSGMDVYSAEYDTCVDTLAVINPG